MPFKVGQKVKFLWRRYESDAKHDEHTKHRVQGSGKIVEMFADEEGERILRVDTGASHYDLPVNDSKHCYIQPLE